MRTDILGYWEQLEAAGQFQPIIDEIAANTDRRSSSRTACPRWSCSTTRLPPPGKATGRYINQPDQGDVDDVHVAAPVLMRDGRELVPPATLESMGFALKTWPTSVADFRDDDEVVAKYYEEMRALVKEASGAERSSSSTHRA